MRTLPLLLAAAAFAPLCNIVTAGEISKADNATALNTGGSWTGGTVPGTSDVAVWSNTVTSSRNTALGADTEWTGIKLNGATGIQTIANASSANLLKLGTSGIDFTGAKTGNSATTGSALVIQAKILLTANQTWNVINSYQLNAGGGTLNQNEDLAFIAQAENTSFDLGGNTITKTGDGTLALSSGYALTNGTINLNEGILAIQSGTNRNISSAAAINVASGTTLRFQTNSNSAPASAVISTGTITLNGGTLNLVQNSGTANTTVDLKGYLVLNSDSTVNLSQTITGSGGQNNPTVISGVISGTGNLKITRSSGSQVLTISGTNIYTGGTTVSGATVSVNGDQSAANGGWLIGDANTGTAIVNFEAGSTVNVAAGKTFRVGGLVTSGSGTQMLNVSGNVTSDSDFSAMRGGNVILKNGATWTQRGALTLQALGGYDATLTLETGSSLSYSGPTAIAINASSVSGTGATSFTISGGTLATSQGLNLNGTTTATGGLPVAKVALTNGGTIKLSADVAEMTTGTAVNTASGSLEVGTGGGVIDTNGHNTSIAQSITGTGSLTKTGGGTLTLAGTNTYSGGTIVDGGILHVTGSVTGSIQLTSGQVLATGNNVNVTLTPGMEFLFDLAAQTSLTVDIGGILDLNGATLKVVGTAADMTNPISIATYGTLNGGTFTGLSDGQTFTTTDGQTFAINYGTNNITLTAIPEPSTYVFGALGMLGALALIRRRRK